MARVTMAANGCAARCAVPGVVAAVLAGLMFAPRGVSAPAVPPLLPLPALRTQPASAAEEQQIGQWIKDLAADRFRVREAAWRHLVKAGNKALPALTRAAQGPNPEAALRAVGILEEQLRAAAPEAASEPVTAALVAVAGSSQAGAAHRARAALLGIQERIVRNLEQLRGTVRLDGERVVAVNLDEVEDLAKALPLLRALPALEDVSLSNPRMNDALMSQLKGLPRLQALNLFMSRIGDDALQHLKTLPRLRHVPMGLTRVTDRGLVHLKDLKQLDYVGLRGNNVTDAGLVHLRGLTNLTGLYLGETKVTDAGLVHLRGLTKMNWLRLNHTRITDAGLEHLRGMAQMAQLTLEQTQVTPGGVARLRQALPKLLVSIEGNKSPQ